MSWFTKLITSTIGQKFISGLTGLFLISFLIVHLSGNFLLFKADEGAAFNTYSEFMSTNMLIRFMEIGLVVGFLLHIIVGIKLYFLNKSARPVNYAERNANANSSFFSRFMMGSGGIILIFLVLHVYTFAIRHRVLGVEGTMYDLVKTAFQDPIYTGFYIIAMFLLGFHLNHGFQSAFQTFGLEGKKYSPLIKFLSTAYAIIVPLLFATMPLYFYFNLGGN